MISEPGVLIVQKGTHTVLVSFLPRGRVVDLKCCKCGRDIDTLDNDADLMQSAYQIILLHVYFDCVFSGGAHEHE